MSLLVSWADSDPATVLRRTSDPAEIRTLLDQAGCRFERRAVRPGVAADADQATVLAAYRDEVERLVGEEGFVTVDVASIHPDDGPDWPQTAKLMRAKFVDEHTHGEDDEVRFMTRGSGVFFLHIGGRVNAVCAEAGDLLGVPQGTTHWFDTGSVPDFTAIRFFHDKQGWVGIPTGSDIARRFPDGDAVRAWAQGLSPAQ